ncbi:uncharacterized protein LOC127527088 [Erpetoichthys calabaricus]|uniref:uncharacterized protein LOC127527088 n=1 Tax=Erpetoichthys calabaricus TaxID=27687 RepID=UPI002233FDA9|nr:uncharacterized protein LOC127527088 [Erpetoichthys calabaricus]
MTSHVGAYREKFTPSYSIMANSASDTPCGLEKPKMKVIPPVIKIKSRRHSLTCSAPLCQSSVACRFFKEDDSEPFQLVSSDSNQCNFTVTGEELLKNMNVMMEDLYFSCDYKDTITSAVSNRSDSLKVIKREVKADIYIHTSEIFHKGSVMVKCEGDRRGRGVCIFYKNKISFQSATYNHHGKACVISVFGLALLNQRSEENPTEVSLSCEIELITKTGKWTSRHSNMVTVKIQGNLGKPELAVTPYVTLKENQINLICELPRTFFNVKCNFYRGNNTNPFVSAKTDSDICERSVIGHELLESGATGMETTVQLRCDYTVTQSPETHSQYSEYMSIRVMDIRKPEISFTDKSNTIIVCKAPPNVTKVHFYLYQEGKEDPVATVEGQENQTSAVFQLNKDNDSTLARHWCQYEYKDVNSTWSDSIGPESGLDSALITMGLIIGLFFISMGTLHLYAFYNQQ